MPFWLDAPLAMASGSCLAPIPGFSPIACSAGRWCRSTGLCLWLPVQSLVLFSVILLPASPAKSRALIAYQPRLVLAGRRRGCPGASAGPIFYDRLLGGHQFAGLSERLSKGAWMVRGEADAMWASFASGRPGLVAESRRCRRFT